MMIDALRKYWWAIVLRGVAAILFGILAVTWPGMTLGLFVVFFGAYALVDGIFAIFSAWRGETRDRWWHVAEGVLGILVGIMTWLWPGVTALTLLYLIAVWAVVTGIAEIAAGIRMRRTHRNEWLLLLSGVLSVAFGAFLVARPGTGALALVLTIGVFAVVFGATLVVFGIRLRRARGAPHAGALAA